MADKKTKIDPGQISMFDLIKLAGSIDGKYSSEEIESVIDKLREAKYHAKKREEEERRRKEEEERKRREREEKERKEAHVQKASNIAFLAEHLDEFSFIPEAKTEEDVGHFLVDNIGAVILTASDLVKLDGDRNLGEIII